MTLKSLDLVDQKSTSVLTTNENYCRHILKGVLNNEAKDELYKIITKEQEIHREDQFIKQGNI